jgi:ferredoxin-NADP reductase
MMIEGPYGAFTRHARVRGRVALIAAGVGVTPLRALLEDLPAAVDVVVMLRGTRREDLVHREEVAALVAQRGGRLLEVVGERNAVRLDDQEIDRLIPDIALRDVFVCGPEGFSTSIVSVSRRLGVPPSHIHRESFAF